jgi:Mg2+ and Co2+ transporter CorA
MNVALPLPGEQILWPFYLINILAVGAGLTVFWFSKVRKW